MAGLEGGFQAALRTFGLACYYDVQVQDDLAMEGLPGIDVPILRNPNLSVLVDEHLELGPYKQLNLFHDGKIATYTTVYPESKLLPQDYLAREAQQALGEVLSAPETARLYAYFKAMLASGHFAPGSGFIRDDCTDIVYNYVEEKARALQHRWETKWWLFKWRQADEIASLRSRIAAAHATGDADRGEIASAAEETLQGLADRQQLINRLDFLTSRPGSPSADRESFPSALETLVPADETFSALIRDALARLDTEGLNGGPSTLEAIRRILEEDLHQTREAILASADALGAERERDLESYLRCLYDPDGCTPDSCDPGGFDPELVGAISQLFSDPAFTRDAYLDAELRYAGLVQPSTLEGRHLWLSELAAGLFGLMEHRLVLLQQSYQQELQLELRRIREERIAWEATCGELLSRGLTEWTAGTKQIADSHERWLRSFVNEYDEKQQMWDGKYLLFRRNREQWVENSTGSAVTAAAQSIARLMDLDSDKLIGEISTITVPRMVSEEPELEALVRRAIPGPGLDELLRDALSVEVSPDCYGRARSLEQACRLASIRPSGPAVPAGRPAAEIVEEISGRIGFVTALQMRIYVEETERSIHERIAEANRSLEENLFELLRSGGYRRSGAEFRRHSVIDKTLISGLEEERQSVPAYRYFIAPEFDAGVDLSRASLEGRSGEYLQDVAARAQANLNRYLELIFGRNEQSREGWDWQGINVEFKACFDAQTALFQGAAGYHRNEGRYHDVDGLFPYHVGYEPVMSSDDPEEVQEPGFGELGSIMEAFYRNEARQARGLSLLCVPWYNLRMWDDDTDNDGEADGWFEAPSARDAVNLAVSIAASATGNVWVAAALNLADDAVFTAADVSSGFVGLEEGVLSFGKQALTSAVTAGTGVGFDALEGALGAFAEEGVCKALLQGAEITTNRVAGATIGAFEFDPQGELMFNAGRYRETLIGRQALRSYLAELSGTAAGSFLEGNLTGFSAEHMEDVMGVSHLAAGLTQASLEYALTGRTLLNLADFSMFGLHANNRVLSGGLIELHIGGDQPRLALGQGGVDLSTTAVADAVSGMQTWIESMRIRGYDRFGTWETAEGYGGYGSVGTSMRSLYSFSDAQGRRLYQDLLDGDTALLVGFAETAGLTQLAGDGLQVHVATLGDARDRNSRLMGGVVLQHEAHRDGVVSDAAVQRLETREAVLAHTDMALKIAGEYGFSFIENDPALLRDVVASRIARVMGEEFYTAYVDQLYESEQADLYSIEKWSGKAIGTNRRQNSYYVIKLEQDTGDAAKHDVRSTIGPVFFFIDQIHNLFSNKDRVQMYRPLYDIVGDQDYIGAFKILYGTGADVVGDSADVVGMIDDVITAYEIIKKTEVPGSGVLNTLSVGLETIDQLVSGIAAGFNTVIEKHFADYWWMSGVPNFATTQSDLEDLTRFMFNHFVEGT
ncbi:MAG: hypothetical protein JXB06_07425, partial [Spirochaetales bacterium]|nr:hypothetical protein [Spirochaetales bacterium]